MSPERTDIPLNRSSEVFKHYDLLNRLTEIIENQSPWPDAIIQSISKKAVIEDKNKYPHPIRGFLIQQAAGASIETTPNMHEAQIAVALSLKDKETLWVLSNSQPMVVKLDTKYLDRKLKSAILKQMQNPATFKYHGFGDKQPLKPFETGNFPFSIKK